MEVNRDNYLEVFPQVLEKLEQASFVSFDAEYTGLKGNSGDPNTLFDTVAERYSKLRNVVHCNSAPQFGLAIFKRLEGPEFTKEQVYTLDAYVFYIEEPFFDGFNMMRTQASIDIDCVQFLNSIYFDYMKWFNSSIPYLNEDRYKECDVYLSGNPEIMNGTRRQLAFRRYKFIKEGDGKNEILLKFKGLARIVDIIKPKRLPVIGHNMALDVLYFYHLFCKDLPEDYDEFKSEVVNFLPTIYDTKFMTVRCRRSLDHPALAHVKDNIDNLLYSGLYVIYKSTSASVDKFSPKIVLSEGCMHFEAALEIGKIKELEDEENSPLCHEASFDACVTGLVFLNLAHIECKLDKELLTKEVPPNFQEVLMYIRNMRDQIFLARASVMAMILCPGAAEAKPTAKWILVSLPSKESVTCSEILDRIKAQGRPEEAATTARLLAKVDGEQANGCEVILAVALKTDTDALLVRLRAAGYQAERVQPPWDETRYIAKDASRIDAIFDTRKHDYLVP